MRRTALVALAAAATAAFLPAQFVRTLGIQPNTPFLGVGAAALDWNRDGELDFVLGDNGTVKVLSIRAGTPSSLAQISTPLRSVRSFDTIDFDLDGRPDVVAAGNSDSTGNTVGFAIILNGAAGTAVRPGPSPIPSIPFKGLICRDFTGDGSPDLVVRLTNDVQLYANDGAGGFASPVTRPIWPSLSDMECDDLDGDGHPDLAFCKPSGRVIFVLWGDGAGGFASTVTTALSEPDSIALADIDRDGDLDIVTSSRSVGDVEVHTNMGGRSFVSTHRQFTRASAVFVVAGDFDRDGLIDAATLGLNDEIALLRGDGTGNLAPPVATAVARIEDQVAPLLGDFDHDGGLDIIAYEGNQLFQLFSAAAAGTLTTIPYGTGTGGCSGTPILRPTVTPSVNSPGFAVTATQAPPRTFGLLGVSATQIAAGYDPLQLGAMFLIDIGPGLTLDPFLATRAGTAQLPLPIPNDATLQGLTVYLQGIWIEGGAGTVCSPGGFVTSEGLSITVQ